jgi:hypothetical protein
LVTFRPTGARPYSVFAAVRADIVSPAPAS